MTALCGILGAIFNGRGDGSRPSRFLDDDGYDEDQEHPAPGLDLEPMDGVTNYSTNAVPSALPTLVEEGGMAPNGGGGVTKGPAASSNGANHRDDAVEEASIQS